MATGGEEAEISSSMPVVMGLVLHLTVGATLWFFVFYRMQTDTQLGAQIIPMASLTGEQGFAGISNVFLILLPILFALLTIYIIQTKLPGIFKDESRITSLISFVQGTLIPIGAVVFFSLLMFQFMNGAVDGGVSSGALMMFTLVVFAVIALAFFIKIAVVVQPKE